ncbi:hypothetical protein [Pontibacter locisalis]
MFASTCLLISVLSGFLFSCNQQAMQEGGVVEGQTVETTATEGEGMVYDVNLSSLNSEANDGRDVSGTARFEVRDSLLLITVNAEGLEPNTMHLQHLHSFETPADASCPPGMEADTNKDGIIDLIETRQSAGITMIPLHDNPVNMEIKTDTYPTTDNEGKLSYQKTVNLNELSSAYKEKFGMDIDLTRHVIFIHGVGSDASLPASVQSLPDVPAHVTLPVACGAID